MDRTHFNVKVEEIDIETNQIILKGYIISRKSTIDVSKIFFYLGRSLLQSQFYIRDDIDTAYSSFSTKKGFELYVEEKDLQKTQEKIIVKYKKKTFYLNIPQYFLEKIYLEQQRSIFGYNNDVHQKRRSKVSSKINSH